LNILIVSQYFWPEQFIINDLVLKIREHGHTVSVFTGKPNYPDGAIYPGYVSQGVQEEIYADNINIFRVPLRPRKNGSGKNLILNYLSFIFSGLKHSYKFAKNRRFDLIIVFAPSPITSAIPAVLLKWLTKSHLAIWVQDLWPESIKATGFIHNRFLLNCISWLVKGIYRFSDTILVQSKAFIPSISRLTQKNKVTYYPNSVIDEFSNLEISDGLALDLIHLLETQFCVVFAGNIGIAQSIDTIVNAAAILNDILDLKFVILGSGSMSGWVKQQVTDKKMNNMIIPGRFPSTVMPFIFSRASGLLVTLKRDEIFTYTVPSKIQSYLAAGKPIIAALDGEGARIVQEAGAGLISPAEDAKKLAKNIKHLYDLPASKRKEMGRLGRSYFLKHFEMETQCRHLIKIFEDKMSKKGNSI
jgi:glycosyltransferase involved in cell wall biosynthesis